MLHKAVGGGVITDRRVGIKYKILEIGHEVFKGCARNGG